MRQQPKETERSRPEPWFSPRPEPRLPAVMRLTADYHQGPAGTWAVTLAPENRDLHPVHREGLPDAHEALHVALDLVEDFAEVAPVGIATVHTLDGDPVAWAELVAREGFGQCVYSDMTTPVLLGHNGDDLLNP